MRLLSQQTIFGVVFACCVFLIQCVGTPMPIPPSVTEIDEEHLAVVIDEEGCDFPPMDECLNISGAPGATEPFATVFVHSLVVTDVMEPLDVDVTADADGAFDLWFVGASDGVFRAIVHGAEASLAVNLRAQIEGSGPWSVVTVEDEDIDSCLELSSDVVDFGAVAVGSTSTQIVDVTNTCDELLSSFGAYMTPFMESVEGDFGAMAPLDDLEPGESMGLVVAFWPESARDHVGVLMVELFPSDGIDTVRMSLPVRGRAVAR
jgi:hypothetical protein